MRLVHLTDPHLSTLEGEKFFQLRGKRRSGYLSWYKNRRKHYLPTVLDKLVESVRAENADQILLTGDLVHIGLKTEIAQAYQWLTTLGSAENVMLVPGNHDIYGEDSADAVFQLWSDYLFQAKQSSGSEDQFPVVRKLGKISLIGLTTACVTPIFMASGKLRSRQLERLDRLLQQATTDGQLVVLLIHHPPLPGMTNWRKGLADAAALQDILKRHPISMIFYGHLHHNHEQRLGDSRIYCTASASSVSDASYRVIDIEESKDSWVFRMSLKSVDLVDRERLAFVTTDERNWQIPKSQTP
jgi:3',5'-cyclic AMP phosphodiesterase CpdA